LCALGERGCCVRLGIGEKEGLQKNRKKDMVRVKVKVEAMAPRV